MDEDAQNLDRIGDIRANDDFKVAVFGRGTMPAFANARAAPTRGGERNGEANIFRNRKPAAFEVGRNSPVAERNQLSRES